MNAANANEPSAVELEMSVGHSRNGVRLVEMMYPSAMPTMPPAAETKTASVGGLGAAAEGDDGDDRGDADGNANHSEDRAEQVAAQGFERDRHNR